MLNNIKIKHFLKFQSVISIVILGLIFSVTNYALAHDIKNTLVTVTTNNTDTVKIEVIAPLEIFNVALGRELADETIPDNFSTYVTERILLKSEGQLWSNQLNNVHVAENYLYVTLEAQAPPHVSTNQTTLEYYFLIDRVDTHRALVYGTDVTQSATFLGIISYNYVTNEINPLPLAVFVSEETTTAGGWWRSVYLGFEHFRHGYDHMLFLLTILLVAPFRVIGRGWELVPRLRQVGLRLLFLSLAFTGGHSIALLYGSFHSVLPYKDLIEFLITVTITISALHAFRPLFRKMDLIIIGMFGVIHGLAFASELSLVDISFWGRVTSVFGFNLGLESFQLLALSVLLPIYIVLLRKNNPTKIRQLIALTAIVISLYWMIERLLLVLN